MKIKKIFIGIGISVIAATPLLGLLAIASDARVPQATSTYLMNFNVPSQTKNSVSNNEPLVNNGNFDDSNIQNQDYINDLKKQVAEVFRQYKEAHPDYQGLTLDYINLKASPTPGEASFFSELNKTLKAINPDLGFKMIQRSPSTMQQGFYQQNTDMVSMYWSPDYNDLGTWLTYMFSDQQIANMWPALSAALNHEILVPNETDNIYHISWVNNLKEYIKDHNFGFEAKLSDGQTQWVPLINSNNQAIGMNVLMSYMASGTPSNTVYATLGNAVSSWADSPYAKHYSGTILNKENTNVYSNNMYKSFQGGIKNFEPALQTNLLDFLTMYKQNIPYVQDGPNTKTTSLVRLGMHNPNNINGANNFRDWYYNPNVYTGKRKTFITTFPNNPFISSVTPLNPAFNRSSNESMFNSTFAQLFTWSVTGDFYNNDSKFKSNYGLSLNANGAYATPLNTEEAINFLIDSHSKNIQKTFGNVTVGIEGNKKWVDIPIRPLPWVNNEANLGKTVEYLSPQDFWAGLKSYERSVQVKLNPNGYFIDLVGLNVNETLNYPGNQERNTNPSQHKSFRFYFNNPTLSGKDIVDILSKQYFSALPAFSPLVQNITNDQKFNEIANLSESNGILNINKVDMSKFYGCGNGPQKSVWSQMWFAGAYTIESINSQRIIYKLNPHYFGQSINDPGPWNDIAEEMKTNPKVRDDYVQYFLDSKMELDYKTADIPKNGATTVLVPIRKFNTVEAIYTSDFNEQLAFEEFLYNEIDTAPIPSAKLAEVYSNPELSKEVYQKTTLKIDKSNLIPYNTRVLEINKDGSIQLFNKEGKEISFTTENVGIDKYGNYIFKNGVHPKIKSKISPGYYDLIVKNFYTPIDAKGPNGKLLPAIDRSSAIIRTAINNCINWFSLTSIIQPGKSQVFQNSFIPYGVANLSDDLTNSRLTYWSLAIYKVTVPLKDRSPSKRFGGITAWTWPEYINTWEAQLKNKGNH